jgi:hypothetical protein
MGLFGTSPGVWYTRCKSDPRWNFDMRCNVSITGGPPKEFEDKIAELTEQYGEPPEDLEYGCMKD